MGDTPLEAEDKTDPMYGPLGFAAAFGTAAAVEAVARFGLPLWCYLVLLAPAALAIPGLPRLFRIGFGVWAGWGTVLFGLCMAPFVLVAAAFEGVRGIAARQRPGVFPRRRKPVDPWTIGVLGMSVSCLLSLYLTITVGIPWAASAFGRPHVRPEEESAVVIAGALLLAVVLVGAAWLRPRDRRAGIRGVALALAAGSLLSIGPWWLYNYALNTERWTDRRAGFVQFGVVVPDGYRFSWGRSGCGTGLLEQSCWQKFYYTAPASEFDSYAGLFPQQDPDPVALPFRAATCAEAGQWELDCAAGDIVVRGEGRGTSVLMMRTATETTLAVEIRDDVYPEFLGRCEKFHRCM